MERSVQILLIIIGWALFYRTLYKVILRRLFKRMVKQSTSTNNNYTEHIEQISTEIEPPNNEKKLYQALKTYSNMCQSYKQKQAYYDIQSDNEYHYDLKKLKDKLDGHKVSLQLMNDDRDKVIDKACHDKQVNDLVQMIKQEEKEYNHALSISNRQESKMGIEYAKLNYSLDRIREYRQAIIDTYGVDPGDEDRCKIIL